MPTGLPRRDGGTAHAKRKTPKSRSRKNEVATNPTNPAPHNPCATPGLRGGKREGDENDIAPATHSVVVSSSSRKHSPARVPGQTPGKDERGDRAVGGVASVLTRRGEWGKSEGGL